MEQEIKDIKELTNDDLLILYSSIQDHIKYLNEQIIILEEETGGATDE